MTLTLTLEREIRKHEDHNDHVVADGDASLVLRLMHF